MSELVCTEVVQRQINKNATRYLSRIGSFSAFTVLGAFDRKFSSYEEINNHERRATNLSSVHEFNTNETIRQRIQISMSAAKRVIVRSRGYYREAYMNNELPPVVDCWKFYFGFAIILMPYWCASTCAYRSEGKIIRSWKILNDKTRRESQLLFFHILSWFDKFDRMILCEIASTVQIVEKFLIHVIKFL
jgi:hypothetical protein